LKEVTVVAPMYQESGLVKEFSDRVIRELEKISKNYELILIDDGSTDNTWKEIKQISSLNLNVKALRFSRTFGHHYAISAGLKYSNSEWVVVMDSDLQDRPEVLPQLFETAKSGFDIVFVSRTKRTDPIYYRILQKTFYFLLKLFSGINFDSRQANFSIISNTVVKAFNSFPEHARFYGSTIKWLGFNSTFIEATHGSRFSGRPSYTFSKRVNLALDIILSFSNRPLKFAIGLGLIFSSLSFLLFVGTISQISYLDNYLGNLRLLFILQMLLSGILLIVLGITGSYIGRIFNEVKRRPLYVISETININ
jgi:dolichol-phosphate mannosyltransferase